LRLCRKRITRVSRDMTGVAKKRLQQSLQFKARFFARQASRKAHQVAAGE